MMREEVLSPLSHTPLSLSLFRSSVLSFLLPIFFRLECHATYNTSGHKSMAWLASKSFRLDPYPGTFRRGEEDTVHFISVSSHSSLIVVIPLFLFSLLSLMFSLLWSVLKPNPQTIGYKSVLIVLFIHPLAKSFMDLGFEVNGRKEIKEIGKR